MVYELTYHCLQANKIQELQYTIATTTLPSINIYAEIHHDFSQLDVT